MATKTLPTDDLEQERQWVLAAKAGDLDAMRPIFEKYSSLLYSAVLLPKLGNPTAAEDVLRDTLSTALQKLDRFEWTGTSIFAWLRQIAVNKAYDVHRKTARTRRLANAVRQEAESDNKTHPAADAQLIAQQEREETRNRIEASMATMNERYQKALRLRLIDEFSRQECAQKMDLTVSTFDVVFFRAVRSFRKQYGERES